MKTITIADDFTKFPGPRYKRLGKGSGEEFRDEILIPAIKQNMKVTVNLNGTKGFGSSFLEEAFGGAVREGIDINRDNLVLEGNNQELLEKIWNYINKAIEEKNNYRE